VRISDRGVSIVEWLSYSSPGRSPVATPAFSSLTFDGEQCRYEGPSVLSAGEVEIVYHNASSESVWFDFARPRLLRVRVDGHPMITRTAALVAL